MRYLIFSQFADQYVWSADIPHPREIGEPGAEFTGWSEPMARTDILEDTEDSRWLSYAVAEADRFDRDWDACL